MLKFLNPYAGAIKLGAFVLGLFALGLLLASWHSRGQDIERLIDWQDQVVIATTVAAVEPDSKGVRKTLQANQVPDAIAGLKRSLDATIAALRGISAEAQAAKQRSDAADARYLAQRAALERRYATAEARIAGLASRPPAATAEAQCVAIEDSSKAAWEAWQ